MNKIKLVSNSVTYILLVLSLFLFALASNSFADPDDDAAQSNIISLHINIVNDEKKNCSDCHADVHTGVSLDPVIPDAHVAMLPFAPGGSEDEDKRDQRCAWCHGSVDLVQTAGSPLSAKSTVSRIAQMPVA